MIKPIQAIQVRGLTACHIVDKGRTIIFGLRAGHPSTTEFEDWNFGIDHALFNALVGNLLNVAQEAERVRDLKPGEKDQGHILELANLGIGPQEGKPGWHLLKFGCQSARGGIRYLISVDRTRLQNLREEIDKYLGNTESSTLDKTRH